MCTERILCHRWEESTALPGVRPGKIRKNLFFKLQPGAAGDDSHLDYAEQAMQKGRHFGIERRFACGKRSVKIEDNQLFHYPITFGV
jgi:hypothetical protein